MKHNYSFSFQNVSIRPLSENDIEFLRKWRNDTNNTKYLRKIQYITPEMQSVWFEHYLSNENELCFAIDEISSLNRIVGSLSLYDFDGFQAELGKILIGDSEAHGKNIGFNSITALLFVAFNNLKLEKVILHVYTENKGAVHIYEKAGFSVVDLHKVNNMDEFLMEISKEKFITLMEGMRNAQHESCQNA